MLTRAQPRQHFVILLQLPSQLHGPAANDAIFSDPDQFELADMRHGRRGTTMICSSSSGMKMRPNMPL